MAKKRKIVRSDSRHALHLGFKKTRCLFKEPFLDYFNGLNFNPLIN